MTFLDFGALLRAEQTELKAQHLAATNQTTNLLVLADNVETSDPEGARQLRDAADQQQVAANKVWYRSN